MQICYRKPVKKLQKSKYVKDNRYAQYFMSVCTDLGILEFKT